MERQLKERLVGATVLVVLMIVVVPLFLDGPAQHEEDDQATVREAMSLPPAQRRPHVITLDGDAPASTAPRASKPPVDEPESAAPDEPESAAPKERTPGQSAPTRPAATRPPAEKPPQAAPATPAPDVGWAVQVGSFSSEKNARTLAADLRESSYSAFHVRKNIDGRVLYRVLIGPERDRERADALASRLRADGLPTTIVRHP